MRQSNGWRRIDSSSLVAVFMLDSIVCGTTKQVIYWGVLRLYLMLLLAYPSLSCLLDYYQCKGADGLSFQQIDRCPPGLSSRLI